LALQRFSGLITELDEASIVDEVYRFFSAMGFSVLKNVRVDAIELDLVLFENSPGYERPLVTVLEVKRRAKHKFFKQLAKRLEISDYVYAVLPYSLYAWGLTRLEPVYGIMLYRPGSLVVLREAKYVGRGFRLLEMLNGVKTL